LLLILDILFLDEFQRIKMTHVENSRKQVRDELKVCKLIENTKITTIGDWIWEVSFSFDKNTRLGKELFCHNLKFKTGAEQIIITINFSPDYPKSVPHVRIKKPKLVFLTGNVNSAGCFLNSILTEKGWNESKKNMITLLDVLRKDLVNDSAQIDMRVNGSYNTLRILEDEERQKQQEMARDKISTNNSFSKKMRVMISSKSNETGDTLILPSSCSYDLRNAEKPLIFEVKAQNGYRGYCGSGFREMEYSAPKGCIVLPSWMVKSLYIKEGDLVDVRSVSLPKGQFCKVQPQSKDFYKIKDHKSSLEKMLETFKTLSEGQHIPLIDPDTKKIHWLEILELQPEKAVLIDPGRDKYLDLIIDFAPAVDFDDSVVLPPVEDHLLPDVELSPISPLPGKKLGSSVPIWDDNTEICENCEKSVPKDKVDIHNIHCARHWYKCTECKITMQMADKEMHNYVKHRQILCECGMSVAKSALKKHRVEKCTEKIRKCQYCEIFLNQSQKEEHEKSCPKKPLEDSIVEDVVIKPVEVKSDVLSDVAITHCKNCGKDVPTMSYTMHSLRCKK
jgi:hypothetical protein